MDLDPPTVLVVDAAGLAGRPGFVSGAHRILASLVRDGAALGWIEPPSFAEVEKLLEAVAAGAANGDAALRAAYVQDPGHPAAATGPAPAPGGGDDGGLAGIGYWTRYERPTHRPHANIRHVAVAARAQGRGVGRAITQALVDSARRAGIEVLTLDARGDNANALRLYRRLGFREYGRLKDFVAVGARRYDTVFCALDLREKFNTSA